MAERRARRRASAAGDCLAAVPAAAHGVFATGFLRDVLAAPQETG